MKIAGFARWRAAAMAASAAVGAVLAGCATMPPEVPFVADANPDRAAVTIYREHKFLNGAFQVMVRIDRKTVGPLKNGELLHANAAPGDLKIAIQSEYDFRELVLPLHAEAGQDYYVAVLPRQDYLQQYAGGALGLPPDKAGVASCNDKWCLAKMPADDAKGHLPKAAS